MPPGLFLCPRCLRGRRPIIEDVEAACESAPKNSLEYQLLENLLSRSSKTFENLRKNIYGISKGCNLLTEENKSLYSFLKFYVYIIIFRIEESLVMALSLEVMDVESYQITFNSEYFTTFPIPENQIYFWRQIQSRMVDAIPLSIIFSSKTHRINSGNLIFFLK